MGWIQSGTGWIQEGVRNFFERLEDAEDDRMFEEFKKSQLQRQERLLKMEEQLAKMEVGKDAGTGRILGGVRNLFGRLDKAVYDLFGLLVDDRNEKDYEKVALHVRAKIPAEMQAWKLQNQSKTLDDIFGEDYKKRMLRLNAELPAMRKAWKLRIQSKTSDYILGEDYEKMLLRFKAELPAKRKEWKRRSHRRLKRLEDWGRDYRKWFDGDLKKISRGTLELELRRLQSERMQKGCRWSCK